MKNSSGEGSTYFHCHIDNNLTPLKGAAESYSGEGWISAYSLEKPPLHHWFYREMMCVRARAFVYREQKRNFISPNKGVPLLHRSEPAH